MAVRLHTSATTSARRTDDPRKETLRPQTWANQSVPDKHQASRIISGAPESICMEATKAASKILRPPSRQARSTHNTVSGNQARAARLLVHIRQLSVNPL